jgi:hypothetical protein
VSSTTPHAIQDGEHTKQSVVGDHCDDATQLHASLVVEPLIPGTRFDEIVSRTPPRRIFDQGERGVPRWLENGLT